MIFDVLSLAFNHFKHISFLKNPLPVIGNVTNYMYCISTLETLHECVYIILKTHSAFFFFNSVHV